MIYNKTIKQDKFIIMVKKYNVKKLENDKPNHIITNSETDKSNHVYHVITNLEDKYNILKDGVILLKDWVYYIDYTECNLNTQTFTFVEVVSGQFNCVDRNGEFLFKDDFKNYAHLENFTRIILNNNTVTLINSFGQILDTVFNENIYVKNDAIENINGVELGKIGVDFKFINNK